MGARRAMPAGMQGGGLRAVMGGGRLRAVTMMG